MRNRRSRVSRPFLAPGIGSGLGLELGWVSRTALPFGGQITWKLTQTYVYVQGTTKWDRGLFGYMGCG